MTSLLDGAKRLVSRGSDLGDRIEALGRASEAARGRLDDRRRRRRPGDGRAGRAPARPDRRPHRRGDRRARPGPASRRRSTHWPGSSSPSVGVRRPTTSWATACVWGKAGRRRAAGLARHPAAPPGHARLAARPRQGGPGAPGRRPARPARPRLDRGLPPPRGRPADRAHRPDGLGARPAEVRRRRAPRPLPRAAGHPPGRHARRAQPHRRGARGPAPVDARRRTPAASTPTASTGVPVLGHERPHRRGHRRAPHRDRRAGRGPRR